MKQSLSEQRFYAARRHEDTEIQRRIISSRIAGYTSHKPSKRAVKSNGLAVGQVLKNSTLKDMNFRFIPKHQQ